MKMVYLTLLALCLFTTAACSHHDTHRDHGHVGNGMAGQTVGTSFPRHLGAGAADTHGSHDH